MRSNLSMPALDVTAGFASLQQQDLVRRCLGGDSSAWETVVTSHGPRIARLVQRYAPLRGEVEDLKQEVFLRVYCNLNTFRVDEGNLDSWVIRVGRNLIVDRLRQIRRLSSRGRTEALEGLELKDDRRPNPETRTLGDEISRVVRNGLRLLSPQLQQALTLRYLQEMNYDEIAGVLGIPNGTVKSRIKRGRDKLAGQVDIQRLSRGGAPKASRSAATVS